MCGYTLKSSTPNQVKGTHTTPVKHYVDDLTFNLFTEGGRCVLCGRLIPLESLPWWPS